jgi:hypothetical protein
MVLVPGGDGDRGNMMSRVDGQMAPEGDIPHDPRKRLPNAPRRSRRRGFVEREPASIRCGGAAGMKHIDDKGRWSSRRTSKCSPREDGIFECATPTNRGAVASKRRFSAHVQPGCTTNAGGRSRRVVGSGTRRGPRSATGDLMVSSRNNDGGLAKCYHLNSCAVCYPWSQYC